MAAILVEFIKLLVAGIPELAKGIGTGVNGFIKDLFLVVDAQGAVIALSTVITTLIFNWIRSIGN